MFITQNQVDLRYIRIEVSIKSKYTCTRDTKFNICSEVDDHSERSGVEEGARELEDGVLLPPEPDSGDESEVENYIV